MPEFDPEISKDNANFSRPVKPPHMSQAIGDLAAYYGIVLPLPEGTNVDELFGEKTEPQFNPARISWIRDTTGDEVATITREDFCKFSVEKTRKVTSGARLSNGLVNIFKPRGVFIDDYRSFVVRSSKGNVLGLRADHANELLSKIKRGEIVLPKDVIGKRTLKLFEAYCEELYLPE